MKEKIKELLKADKFEEIKEILGNSPEVQTLLGTYKNYIREAGLGTISLETLVNAKKTIEAQLLNLAKEEPPSILYEAMVQNLSSIVSKIYFIGMSRVTSSWLYQNYDTGEIISVNSDIDSSKFVFRTFEEAQQYMIKYFSNRLAETIELQNN